MKLSIISCNIRFDNPADGANAWPQRRHLLTETLLKHQPDIISTQEGRQQQLKDFEALLQDFELVDSHRSWIKERMYPSIYVRKGRFEILRSEDLWLSETPEIAGSHSFNSAFPRLMTWVKLQPVDSEKNLLVVNTHLDHLRGDTRAAQAKVLIQEVKRFWKGECPIIFTGDFNEGPDFEVRELFVKNFPGIQDSWQLFNSHEETSHHAFKGEIQNGSRIDWILVDPSVEVESCTMDKFQREGLFPTDHFPIVAHVKL